MTAIAARLGRFLSQPKGTIRIGDIEVTALRPVRKNRSGNAENKAGRLVLVGEASGQKVKIYEAASKRHADFLAQLGELGHPAIVFPAILALAGRFILCEWVEGNALSNMPMSADRLKCLGELQARLHSVGTDKLRASDFNYWHNVIAPRFVRASELVGMERLAENALAIVEEWQRGAETTFNHPDLSLDNVVRTGKGLDVPIDNELAYVGAGSFMDVLNTLNSLPSADRAAYGHAYLAAPGARPMPPVEVLRAFWLARQAGSRFAAGEVGKLSGLFNSFGESADPDGVVSAIAFP